MKILVADDDPCWQLLIGRLLKKWGHESTVVENGKLAADLLAADPTFDVLITDWNMPLMPGPQLCAAAREIQRPGYLFIILQTGLADKDALVEGLNSGADAFISKPIQGPELLAHLRVADRVLSLENRLAQNLDQLRRANNRMRDDLVAAARVQRALLPRGTLDLPGVEFAWVYEATDEVGGDMCNFLRLDESHAAMTILDVSGHGVQAALLSAALNRVLTAQADTLGLLKRPRTDGQGYEIVPPAEVARQLNRHFPTPPETNQYFTFLYGVLDLPQLTLRMVRAGHPDPLIVSASGVRELKVDGGLPIGFMDDAEYTETTVKLKPGEAVVFYTDGVVEAFNASEEQFGFERMQEVLHNHRDQNIGPMLRSVSSSVCSFCGPIDRNDDITMVGFRLT